MVSSYFATAENSAIHASNEYILYWFSLLYCLLVIQRNLTYSVQGSKMAFKITAKFVYKIGNLLISECTCKLKSEKALLLFLQYICL